jgi:hypothetical protein
MSARAGALPALSLWVLVIALNVTMVAPYQLDWYGLTHPVYRGAQGFAEALFSLLVVLMIPAYATVGAVIATLRPMNSIGWLCFVPSLLLVAVGWR